MKLSDIIWGGNHKLVAIPKNPINGLKAGDEVKIEYNYLTNSFELTYEGKTTTIIPANKLSENELELLKTGRSSMNTILDIDVDGYMIQLRIFEEIILLGALSTLKIAFNDDIALRAYDKGGNGPAELLKDEFVYTDPATGREMLFVKGYGKNKAEFSLLSRKHRLNIKRNGESYIAVNYTNYNANYSDRDAVYLLVGKIEFVDYTVDAKISAELDKSMKRIQSGGSYFEIWDAYLSLEKTSLLLHAKDTGQAKYKSFSSSPTAEGYRYTFVLDSPDIPDFARSEMLDAFESNIVSDENLKPENILEYRTVKVGAFERNSRDTITVVDSESSSINTRIPASGYLFTSLAGDKVRMMRCEQAKEKITNNRAEIDRLQNIIEDGSVVQKEVGDNNAVTNKLKELPEFKNRAFNSEQEQAIYNAINTPDISLILGPPGTGKTFTIKAIVARFEELFKKNNPNETPNILISSFQHEAVDNVAIGIQNDGLPPNRIGGKKVEGSSSFYITDWKKKKTAEISAMLDKSVAKKASDIETLREQILAWESKGKDIAEGIGILKSQLSTNIVRISDDIQNEARIIISQVENKSACTPIDKMSEDENEERRNILLSQRTDLEAFSDDGIRQAKKLKISIEDEGLFPDMDVTVIADVIKNEGKNQESFEKYVKLVNKLKEKYVEESISRSPEQNDIPKQLGLILRNINGELRKRQVENKDDSLYAETIILNQYMDMIQDDVEVKRIIKNYSSINAATCQQSLDIRRGATEKRYDLVIIDEAARANPLDLMIPMSMGKKVILVGDHKQLPHMLSPEVVNEYRKTGKEDQLGILQESMFERIFNLFESLGAKKRTVRLTKQYRMNPIIGDFASKCFYEDKNGNPGLDSSFVDITKKKANLGMYSDKPLVFLDLRREKFGAETSGLSKSRPSEVELILQEVSKVLKKDISKSVGIITFYKRQANLFFESASKYLTDGERERVEIGTVDAFQGKEFDIVFLSCVRANNYPPEDIHRKIGHSNDKNRLCVSFTRARQLLVTVGDGETLSVIPEMKSLIALCKEGKGGHYECITKN